MTRVTIWRSQESAQSKSVSATGDFSRDHGRERTGNTGNTVRGTCRASALQTPPQCPIQKDELCTIFCRSNFRSSDLDCDPVLHRSPVSRSKFSRIFCCTSWLAEYLRSIHVFGNRVVITVRTSGYSSGIVIPPASVTIFLLEIRQFFFLVEYWWLAKFLRRICCWEFDGCEGLGIRVW